MHRHHTIAAYIESTYRYSVGCFNVKDEVLNECNLIQGVDDLQP